MALAITEPTAEVASTSNSASYAMGAFTPTANSLLVCMVFASGTVAAGSMSGGGLTWTRQTSIAYSASGYTAYLFTAPVGASPVSTTPTFDCTGDNATGAIMMIWQVTGNNVGIVQVDAEARTAADPTITMPSALSTSNAYMAGFGVPRNPPTSTAPGSWSEIADTGYNSPASGASGAYRVNGETGSTITFTSASAAYGILAIEVYEAPITGTLTKTLDAATVASVGDLDIAGTASPTLDAATLASAGDLDITASFSKTLDAVTLSSAGTVVDPPAVAPSTTFGANLKHWFKEAYSAGTWTDAQGNANATQGTSGYRPTATTVNGHTALSFDGTDDFLTLGDITALDDPGDGTGSGWTIFTCYKTDIGVGDPIDLFSKGSLGTGFDAQIDSNGVYATLHNTGDSASYSGDTTNNVWCRLVISYYPESVVGGDGYLKVRVNNGGNSLDDDAAAHDFANNASEFWIGQTPTWTQPFNGEFSCFGIVDRVATQQELNELDNYLSNWLTGTVPVDGTLAKTLDAATVSGVGDTDIAGTASPTLAAATLSSAGDLDIVATLSKTLDAATLSSTGDLDIVGSLAKTLDAATLASVGDLDITGTLSKTLDAATLSSAGTVSSSSGGDISATLGTRLYRWQKDYTLGNWDDIDGNVDATQATGSLQPAVQTTTGGQSYPDFDGGDRVLSAEIASLPTYNSAHHFIWGCLIRVDVAGLGWIYGVDNQNYYVNGDSKIQVAGAISNSTVNDGVWRRLIVTKNGSSGTVTMYIDGVAQTTTATEGMGSDWKTSTEQWFGDRPGGGYPFNGGLASMFWGTDTTAFSAGDVTQLDTDLQIILEGGGYDHVGTLTATLGAVTLSSAGDLDITGTLAKTLDAVTLSSAGDLDIVGSASPTLAAVTLSSAGDLDIVGSSSNTLAAATLASAGSAPATGTLTQTLAAVTLSSVGDTDITATLARTLDAATLSSAGDLDIVGSLAKTLDAATLASVGDLDITGSLSRTLADVTLTSAGTNGNDIRLGTLTATLDAVTLNSVGDLDIAATLSQTLGTVTLASAGDTDIAGSLSQTLGAVTLSSVGDTDIVGSLSRTLGSATLASAGDLDIVGSLAKTLDAATLFAQNTPVSVGSLAVTLAPATLASVGDTDIAGTLSRTLAAATLASAGDLDIVGTASPTLAAATLTSAGGLVVQGALTPTTLAEVGIAATASAPATGTLAVTLDSIELLSTSAISGTLATTLAELAVSSTGSVPATGTFVCTLESAYCQLRFPIVPRSAPVAGLDSRPGGASLTPLNGGGSIQAHITGGEIT